MTIVLLGVMNWRPVEVVLCLFDPRIIARKDTILTGALSDDGHRTSGYGLGEAVPVLLLSSWHPEHNRLYAWLPSQRFFVLFFFAIDLHRIFLCDLDTADLRPHQFRM